MITLKVTFTPNIIYTLLDRGMVLLQVCAGSFHIKKLCSRLYSIKLSISSRSRDREGSQK